MSEFRKKPEAKSINIRKSPIAIGAISLFSLLFIWGIYLLATSSNNNDTTTDSNTTISTPTPLPVETDPIIKHGATGKSLSQDQKDSLAAAKKVIEEAGVSPNGMDIGRRLTELDTDNYEVVSPKLVSMVRFPTPAQNGFKSQTYQSLITVYGIITEGGKKKVPAPSNETYKSVYVDSQLGIAFVPLGAFTGTKTTFTFEMVNVNGQWKLAPYSLLQSVRLSAMLGQAQQQGTPSN